MENNEEKKEIQTVESEALYSITKSEIDMQIATAKKWPRSIEKFRKNALTMATIDQPTAASCFYKLKRHDKEGKAVFIEGPSIRLAEICNTCYQNMRTAARIIEINDTFVVAQGASHDLENNNMSMVEVRRKITGKSGKKFSEDMIGVTCNAAIAIAFRNATFKNIPKSYVNQIYETCKQVAIGNATSTGELRQQWFSAFTKMGVDEKQLLKYLEKPSVDDVGIKDIENLIGVFNAIKNGETTIEEEFSKENLEKGENITTPKAKDTPKEETPAAEQAAAPQGDLFNEGKESKQKGKNQLEYEEFEATAKQYDKKKWPKLEKKRDDYCNQVSLPMDLFEEKHYAELLRILKGN